MSESSATERLREALCEALDCIGDNIDIPGTEWADRSMKDWLVDWRAALAATSQPPALDTPEEITDEEHKIATDFLWGTGEKPTVEQVVIFMRSLVNRAPDAPTELIAKWRERADDIEKKFNIDPDCYDVSFDTLRECSNELEAWWASRASGPAKEPPR